MASDLAGTPSTGTRVQACGDCHLLNFGLFASPERRLLFDINDFDETLPAPWEWDVKRLAVSAVNPYLHHQFDGARRSGTVISGKAPCPVDTGRHADLVCGSIESAWPMECGDRSRAPDGAWRAFGCGPWPATLA
jgi:hypothetical protein